MKKNYDGDVVLVHDESKPRLQWTIGIVDKINPSRVNKVRSVIEGYMKKVAIFGISRSIS